MHLALCINTLFLSHSNITCIVFGNDNIWVCFFAQLHIDRIVHAQPNNYEQFPTIFALKLSILTMFVVSCR